jgi:hypothetical protein
MIATCTTNLHQKQRVVKNNMPPCLYVDLTRSRHAKREDIARLQVLAYVQLCPSQVMNDRSVCLGAGSNTITDT